MVSLEDLGRFSSNLTYIVGRIQFCFVFQAVGQGPFSTSLPCGTFHRAAYSMATGFPQSTPSKSQRWGARQMSQSFCNLILQVTALWIPARKDQQSQSKRLPREFPSGLLVRIWCFHWCGLGSIPGQGTEILQAKAQLKKKKAISIHPSIHPCLKIFEAKVNRTISRN